MQKKNSKTQNQLESYIEMELLLNTKWKQEMKKTINKFEKRIHEIKGINRTLKNKLQLVVNEWLRYRTNSANLTNMCADVPKMVNKDKPNENF